MSAAAQDALTEGDHFFAANGVRFHYLVRGRGPLFVAHSVGWGMPGQYLWNGLGPHLERYRTVVYFEPRANGQSGLPPSNSSPASSSSSGAPTEEEIAAMSSGIMAEDIEALRLHLGADAIPALFGHSNGACIALRYAQLYPSRVEKLILCDAEVHDAPANDAFQTWMGKRKDDPVYGPALAALVGAMRSPPQTDDAFGETMDQILPYYFSDVSHVATLKKHLAGVTPRVWPFLRQSVADRQDDNRLPHVAEGDKVTAETLLIWGEEDAMCSLVAARAVVDSILRAKLVTIGGVGHLPWIEKPEEFWKPVDEFLIA